MKTFTLEILTQEKHLLSQSVKSVSAMTESGEITILADHIPLFSRLQPGELTYRYGNQEVHFAVTGGFIDVAPNGITTVMADSAVRADNINLEKVQQAIENAKKALESAPDQKTSLMIEMELRNAVLQQNIAKKRKSSH